MKIKEANRIQRPEHGMDGLEIEMEDGGIECFVSYDEAMTQEKGKYLFEQKIQAKEERKNIPENIILQGKKDLVKTRINELSNKEVKK